jgi:3-deoxy-7-phosphoheptulonate synthase
MESLPTYQQLKKKLPLSSSQRSFVKQTQETIRAILNGTDSRLLLIVGPCSIHDVIAAKEYASKLKELNNDVSSEIFIAMRTYFEKPRTSSGWKGFLYDPYLDGSHQIHSGLEQSRQLLLDLAEMEIPTATEFLDPMTAYYYDDLISWGSIGARTSSSQPHRQLASGLSMPIGFKNGIAGNISPAVHGVMSASMPQTYIGLNENGQTTIIKSQGNPNCHIVLRGGDLQPNYDPASVAKALTLLEQAQLPQRLLIDCSHQNSGKKHDRQPAVFQSILHQIIEGNGTIRGIMLESHLYGSSQPLSLNSCDLKYGVSITDSCLDWPSTKHLILWAASQLNKFPATEALKY